MYFKYKSNTYRIKLRENIIKSIDDYIFNDLKKNVLFPKMLNIRTNKESKLKCIYTLIFIKDLKFHFLTIRIKLSYNYN